MLAIAAMCRTEDLQGRRTHRGDPESYAAPARGEGGSVENSGRREPAEPEQAPVPESTGAWASDARTAVAALGMQPRPR
jgi:hypothetical protein